MQHLFEKKNCGSGICLLALLLSSLMPALAPAQAGNAFKQEKKITAPAKTLQLSLSGYEDRVLQYGFPNGCCDYGISV